MNKLSLNTHDYDGKWKDQYNILKTLYFSDDLPSFPETIQEIRNDITTFNYGNFQSFKKNVIRCLQLFVNGSNKENVDRSNEVIVEDVLRMVWNKVKTFDNDCRFIFYEQLSDIATNGSCAEGRTTRLMQFLDLH